MNGIPLMNLGGGVLMALIPFRLFNKLLYISVSNVVLTLITKVLRHEVIRYA